MLKAQTFDLALNPLFLIHAVIARFYCLSFDCQLVKNNLFIMFRNIISRIGRFIVNCVSRDFWGSEFGLTVKWFIIIYFIFCPIVAYVISQCIN